MTTTFFLKTVAVERPAIAPTVEETLRKTVRFENLTKSQAEDLLDWLEGNGYALTELSLSETGFTVEYLGDKRSISR